MFFVRFSKKAILYGMLGISFCTVRTARAERVITDYEASRLTFAALTTPVAPARHRKLSFHHVAHRSTYLARNTGKKQKASLYNVSYHGRVITKHKRNSHHRRG